VKGWSDFEVQGVRRLESLAFFLALLLAVAAIAMPFYAIGRGEPPLAAIVMSLGLLIFPLGIFIGGLLLRRVRRNAESRAVAWAKAINNG